ncbi:MAG: succinate--CoA ligase subunit alpha [Candidatus Hydrothermales bacterium]
MAILLSHDTRVLVQGITGRDGSFHAIKMKEYGTKVVAGVTPSKGGQKVDDIPVFNSVSEAVRKEGANTSVIFVPAPFAKDAMYEAIDAGIKLIVTITEGIPAQDMAEILDYIKGTDVRIIGPNCPGIIAPSVAKVGIMPGHIFKKGPVGVVSRSGTLTYEVVYHLTNNNLGQSTAVGIGGDPIIGTRFIDLLELFEKDSETECIVLIGEIGGTDEEDAAEYIKKNLKKPVVAFIAGRTAPPEKRMGHAGAIIEGGKGTAESKINALKEANVSVATLPSEVAILVKNKLSK